METTFIGIIQNQLPHLLEKIDIILVSSITLMGFMIASLSILKIVIPKNIEKSKTLKDDILKQFKYSIYLLIFSAILSTIAFFFNVGIPYMKYVAFISFIVFIFSIYFIYSSIKIIFLLEEDS